MLTHQLKNSQIAHYALRATPDGEGNWSYDAPFSLAQQLRHKRKWDARFENAVETTIMQRPLPFLVDVGGKPTERQQELFGHCSHYIILGKNEEEWHKWRTICKQQQLQPLAEIRSVLEGEDAILCQQPYLQLQLSQLDRERNFKQPLSIAWQRLIEQVATIIGYTEHKMWNYHRSSLPFDALALNLEHKVADYDSNSRWWNTQMLPRLLQEVCQESPLAIYGRAPTWVASALALHTLKPIRYFDAQYGWLTPPTLQDTTDNGAWRVIKTPQKHLTELAFTLCPTHLAPQPTLTGPLPAPLPGTTIILSGKLPIWLYIALARHYRQYGNPIAIADPRLKMPDNPERKAAVQIYGPEVGKHVPWEPTSVKE